MIDITHGIAPTNVLQGALVLASTLPYMPEGVHLAVVDPGVGSDRKPLALRGGDGRLYVGPDNGLLLVAVDRFGGVEEAVELAEAPYRLEPVARTFHGRDIFAPAAAHLAGGVELDALGPKVAVGLLVRLELPSPDIGKRRIRATVLDVDRFGNVRLNLRPADLDQVGIDDGSRVEVEVGFERYYAVAALHLRRGAARRHRPLRGRLREHRSGHQSGRRGQDVRGRGRRGRPPDGCGRVNELAVGIGKRFARFATRAVVRWPALWRLFRWPLRAQFDALARQWQGPGGAGAVAPLTVVFERVPRPPARILDLGTGTGNGAQLAAGRFPDATVTGVDMSPGMIAEAGRRLPAEFVLWVRFEVADASALSFEDGGFDLVLLLNMIPFFSEIARLMPRAAPLRSCTGRARRRRSGRRRRRCARGWLRSGSETSRSWRPAPARRSWRGSAAGSRILQTAFAARLHRPGRRFFGPLRAPGNDPDVHLLHPPVDLAIAAVVPAVVHEQADGNPENHLRRDLQPFGDDLEEGVVTPFEWSCQAAEDEHGDKAEEECSDPVASPRAGPRRASPA